MALIRGFSKVSETGKITIPGNILRAASIEPGKAVQQVVLRIKGTSRYPHSVIYPPGHDPLISPFEAVMLETSAITDDKGGITLSTSILEEMRLQPGYRVEMKILGPDGLYWIVLYNRGPWRETTLRQRMGVNRGIPTKGPKTQVWNY